MQNEFQYFLVEPKLTEENPQNASYANEGKFMFNREPCSHNVLGSTLLSGC